MDTYFKEKEKSGNKQLFAAFLAIHKQQGKVEKLKNYVLLAKKLSEVTYDGVVQGTTLKKSQD